MLGCPGLPVMDILLLYIQQNVNFEDIALVTNHTIHESSIIQLIEMTSFPDCVWMEDFSEYFDDDDIYDKVLLDLPLEYPFPPSEHRNFGKQPVAGVGVTHLNNDDSGIGSHDGMYIYIILILG